MCCNHFYTQRATFRGEIWPIVNEQKPCGGVRRHVATGNLAAPMLSGVVTYARAIPIRRVVKRQRSTDIQVCQPMPQLVGVLPMHGLTDPAGACAPGLTHPSGEAPFQREHTASFVSTSSATACWRGAGGIVARSFKAENWAQSGNGLVSVQTDTPWTRGHPMDEAHCKTVGNYGNRSRLALPVGSFMACFGNDSLKCYCNAGTVAKALITR